MLSERNRFLIDHIRLCHSGRPSALATEVLNAGSTKHNIPDTDDPKIPDSKIWFGKISRAGFQILFHFLDLPKPVRNHLAIRFVIGSQATEEAMRHRKIS